MSDKMYPISFRNLLKKIFEELQRHSSIFSIPKINFINTGNDNHIRFLGERLSSPVGPAAGPHTQMTQNIIASYLCGARFIELKTVQILDEIEVVKPCIDAQDEGYNIEWSQELTLIESYDEYLKAWILTHIIGWLFDLNPAKEADFIFNMSVGYDLKGIKSEQMNKFINQMMNADTSTKFDEYIRTSKEFLERAGLQKSLMYELSISKSKIEHTIELLDSIPRKISNSVTISTMHGCPPDEIENIAGYLISEMGLHTYVKLNPTLLGYERVRSLLNETGYNYVEIKKESFTHDLQMTDAVPMISRLTNKAKEKNVRFGVKLSNTLGVVNNANNLTGDEKYMSGRSLYPLTINLAYELAKLFDGEISISFSGGANAENILEILNTGIYPVTLVTDLLKPGGYTRFNQLNKIASQWNQRIDEIDIDGIKDLSESSVRNSIYKKETREIKSIKIEKTLPGFDCYIAPCVEACPIHQDVPEYINLVGQNRHKEALELILTKNPLPHITGYICDHQCMFHCTRWDYDSPVLIRDIKKEAALQSYDDVLKDLIDSQPGENNGIRAAIIGAGPAGLAAAFFLLRAGFDVTIFEKEMNAGGIVRNVIPSFRLPEEVIDKDIKFIEKLGGRFVFGFNPDFSIDELRSEGFKYIFIGIGAGKSTELVLEKNDGWLLNAVDYLWDYKNGLTDNIGNNVAVIGGGNSAMDSARAAKRSKETENVYIIYRRTKEFMPADMEEFNGAVSDGVIFKELLQPVKYLNGKLICEIMELDEFDSDGRRKVKRTGSFEEFEIDTIISAIGEKVDTELLENNDIYISNGTTETNIENVFVGGDALRGPSTIIESIADGKKTAEEIMRKENLSIITQMDFSYSQSIEQLNKKHGSILQTNYDELQTECSRCLNCNILCNKCVDVCPNRANVPVNISGDLFNDQFQILHINSICNECGNCETFCPYQGKPFKDKITLFHNRKEFEESSNSGFYIDTENVSVRLNGKLIDFERDNGSISWGNIEEPEMKKMSMLIDYVVSDYSFLL